MYYSTYLNWWWCLRVCVLIWVCISIKHIEREWTKSTVFLTLTGISFSYDTCVFGLVFFFFFWSMCVMCMFYGLYNQNNVWNFCCPGKSFQLIRKMKSILFIVSFFSVALRYIPLFVCWFFFFFFFFCCIANWVRRT